MAITKQQLESIFREAECAIQPAFERLRGISLHNQEKVLKAFQDLRISTQHFYPSTGYGYGDIGRDMLDRLFASVFHTEDTLVRPQIASGTHALALALQGVLEPGQTLLSVTGKPYDTLEEVIGIRGDAPGSLRQLNIGYRQVELTQDHKIDPQAMINALDDKVGLILIQRSRGYAWRDSLSVDQIGEAIQAIKAQYPKLPVLVDNCYGEFVEVKEPTDAGADLIVGSLIKNPGGGLAPTGGYIAGRHDLIERVAQRMTAPGIGREVGSYVGGYQSFYQGLFIAPHVVIESVKGAILAAEVMSRLGYDVLPKSQDVRHDIIQSIRFNAPEALIAFCQGIQMASPVDSFAVPEPWEMPGYEHPVIMAAGTFIQGASIELSADAPVRPPYIAYLQGGLTYEHCRLALMQAVLHMG